MRGSCADRCCGRASSNTCRRRERFFAFVDPWHSDGPAAYHLQQSFVAIGSGTPAQGAKVYAEKCAMCHGPEGKGGGSLGAGPLIGNPGLGAIDSPKMVANMYA